VEAGRRFGIPVYGTMAHSYVEVHDDEEAAFLSFADAQPGNVTLLIDTYDTEAAAQKVVRLAPRLRERGIRVRGVRLDSGDLVEHARRVRAILDAGGLAEVSIFTSSSLDEGTIATLLAAGAPVDGFGIGTRLDTSADAPYLDMVYKLQEYDGVARRKHSEGKATWPGRKQVWRRHDAAGRMAGDVVSVEGDAQDGEPLLVPVMRGGETVRAEPLAAARARAAAGLAALPEALRGLGEAPGYPVTIAPALRELAGSVDRRLGSRRRRAT
jgi:nicotinate phosphoribosyltransferase